MNLLKTFTRSLAAGAVMVAGAAMFAGTASAQNTTANTAVENTFTLDYQVGTVSQDQITNDTSLAGPGVIVQGSETTFTVDRKIDLTVVETNSPNTVTPNQTSQALTYVLTNLGNDNQTYSVDLLRNGSDEFDAVLNPTTIAYEVFDEFGTSLGTGTVTEVAAGTATTTAAQRTIDVPPNGTVTFTVTANIPSGLTDGDQDAITLIAETRDPTDWVSGPPATPTVTATGTAGALTRDDSDTTGGNDTTNAQNGAADNVLADGSDAAVTGDTDNDGKFGAIGAYVVASPDLFAIKSVSVIATEPTACATQSAAAGEQYSVPAACVEYRILVANTGATATASNLNISDTLPAALTFVGASLVVSSYTDATPTTFTGTNGFEDDPVITGTTGPLLQLDGGALSTTDCTGTNCVVTLTDAILAAGEVGEIVIRATVD